MLRIGDVVAENDRAAEVGDVQIGWYPDSPYNAELVKKYMFTASAEKGKRSSVDLLKTIRDTFLYPRENRLTIIATYGHGKTHLALALANFFGKPSNTPEVNDLLANLKHSSESAYVGLEAFKEENPPFLVVRLQGNANDSLPRLFMNALTQALKEVEPIIGAVSPPFWFSEATTFLINLQPDKRAQADSYLETYRHDTASLLAAVQAHDASVFELCRSLSRALYGAPLDFGSDTSLDQLVTWVTKHYCGRDKPLRGLLVLFDEFAVFVEKYAERRIVGNTGALQQLLDGISNSHDSACLVAFSQADPSDVASRIFSRTTGHAIDESDLNKELTRLPADYRFLLHSSLERVLDVYLKQIPERLAEVMASTGNAFTDATDVTIQYLPQRYDYQQGWGSEEVFGVLTEGCFPLHPLTTGLLCTMQLHQGTVTRSVLGSVRQALKERQEEAAVLSDNRPNWIYPVALVDWFGDMISDERRLEEYKRASESIGGDATPTEKSLIKAVLLQITANLTPLSHGSGGYARLAAALTGHSEKSCQEALDSLTNRYLLEKDPVKELYRFPQGGAGDRARELMKELERRSSKVSITGLTISDDFTKADRLKTLPAEGLAAGNPQDYGAKEWVLDRTTFTVDMLRDRIARRFKMGPKGFEQGDRGAIIYLLASTEDDVAFFDSNAQRILDEAFPATADLLPVPVVVGCPLDARPRMMQRIRFERTLNAMESELREYGAEAAKKVRQTLSTEIETEWKLVRTDAQWIVPTVFAPEVNRSAAKNDPKMKLDCCYNQAYADMPPAFKRQYTSNASQLRTGVKMVAESLAKGKLAKEQEAIKNANGPARDIIQDYLVTNGQPGSWGILDSHGQLQIPIKPRVRKAWEALDKAFAPGEEAQPICNALIAIFNPPFGYDANHTTLLLCAWLGYHQGRFNLQERGQQKNIFDYIGLLAKPIEFIEKLCDSDVRLFQVSEESESKRIEAIIEKIKARTLLTSTDARNYRTELEAFAKNEGMKPETRTQAEKAAAQIAIGQEEVKKYEAEVAAIKSGLTNSATIPDVILQWVRIGSNELTVLSLVASDSAPDITALRKMVRDHIIKLVRLEAEKHSVLKQLESYTDFKNHLEQARSYASQVKETALEYEVDAKIAAMEERKKELEAEQEDRVLVAELNNLHIISLPIVELTNQAARLENSHAQGERAKSLLEKKKEDIEKALVEAREFVEKLPEAIDIVATVRQAEDQKSKMDRRQARYEGSLNEAEFERNDERLADIKAALSVIEKTSVRALITPREWDARKQEIWDARDAYRANLSSSQLVIFGKKLKELDEFKASETEKALEWLEKYERKSPRDVAVLDAPPAFLSADGKKRLKVLRTRLQEEIQKRIDLDETAAILSRFQKLSVAKRRECLRLLQQQLGAQEAS